MNESDESLDAEIKRVWDACLEVKHVLEAVARGQRVSTEYGKEVLDRFNWLWGSYEYGESEFIRVELRRLERRKRKEQEQK